MEEFSFEARVLNTPYEKPDVHHSLSMPVYNTAAYEFDTAEDMEAAFCGRTTDHAYSRITNPTVQYFEDRVRTISGAMGVTALNSGMAAISNTLMCSLFGIQYCNFPAFVWQHLVFYKEYTWCIRSGSPFL